MADHPTVTQGRARRAQIISFVTGYQADHGYPPTISEIARGVGVSRTTTHQHLRTLRAHGLVRWTTGQLRTVTVVARKLPGQEDG